MDNNELIQSFLVGEKTEKEVLEQLYSHNLPFIQKICNRYTINGNSEDLLQESFFAIEEALKTYDKSKNMGFLTWLEFYLKRSCDKVNKNEFGVSISYDMLQKYKRFQKEKRKYYAENGFEPELYEIAEIMGISIEKASELSLLNVTKSLDYEIDDEEGNKTPLLDLIEDEKADFENNLIDDVYHDEIKNGFWEVVSELESEESDVIHKRFKENMNLSQVAAARNESVEETKKIQAKAFRHLRTPDKMKKFGNIVEDTINYYLKVSVERFQNHSMSSVEILVFDHL